MFNRFIIIMLVMALGLMVGHSRLHAQCFASPGNPIAGNTNLGILDRGITRAIGFVQYSLMDQYFEGSRRSDYDPTGAITSAHYTYTGFSLGYGLTGKLTLEAEVGYFLNRTQQYRHIDYSMRSSGFANAIVTAKYNLFQDLPRNLELTLSAGPKIPLTTKPQVADGVELPIGMQSSTGNFGFVVQSFFVKEFDVGSIRLILINRYENNLTENQQGYAFGDSFMSSLFFSKHLANPWTRLTKDITFILQTRHEYRTRSTRNGQQINYSGHNLLFVAPQLNYNLGMVWNFSVMVDIPLYQYFNGIQLGNSHAITFSVARDVGYRVKSEK